MLLLDLNTRGNVIVKVDTTYALVRQALREEVVEGDVVHAVQTHVAGRTVTGEAVVATGVTLLAGGVEALQCVLLPLQAGDEREEVFHHDRVTDLLVFNPKQESCRGSYFTL